MTTRELAAYRAGLCQAAHAALVTALALEMRNDAGAIRQQAAIAALRGLAEGLKAEAAPADALPDVMARIAQDPATSGVETCPNCAGRLRWVKDASNGHIHAECEGAECLRVMQ